MNTPDWPSERFRTLASEVARCQRKLAGVLADAELLAMVSPGNKQLVNWMDFMTHLEALQATCAALIEAMDDTRQLQHTALDVP